MSILNHFHIRFVHCGQIGCSSLYISPCRRMIACKTLGNHLLIASVSSLNCCFITLFSTLYAITCKNIISCSSTSILLIFFNLSKFSSIKHSFVIHHLILAFLYIYILFHLVSYTTSFLSYNLIPHSSMSFSTS